MMLAAVVWLSLGQATYCPAGNVSAPEACTLHGDPVDLNYGGYVLTREDTPAAGHEPRLFRYFSSKEDTWVAGTTGPSTHQTAGSVIGVPKPFGEATAGLAMHWWHNWYSFVEVRGAGASSTVHVRQPGGRTTSWGQHACDGSWLQATTFNIDERLKVRCLASGGYEVVLADGSVLTYAARLQLRSEKDVVRYFLSTKRTSSSTIDVTYSQPFAATGGLLAACPRPDSSNWVPYLRTVRDRLTGAALRFTYEAVQSQGETRCPIRVVLAGHATGLSVGNDALAPLVEYTSRSTGGASSLIGGQGGLSQGAPRPSPGGGSTVASGWRSEVRLATVKEADGSSVLWRERESYTYGTKLVDPSCLAPSTEKQQRTRCTSVPTFRYGSLVGLPTEVELDVSGTVVTRVVSEAQDISYGFDSTFSTQVTMQGLAAVGSASPTTPLKSKWLRIGNDGTHSGRLSAVSHETTDLTEAYFPPGNPSWDWTSSGSSDTQNRLSVSAGGIRTLMTHARDPATSGGAFLSSVQRGVAAGAPASGTSPQRPGHCFGLECTWWTPTTDASGVVRPGVEFRPSAMRTGDLTETRYRYHPNGLLAETITRGWTLDLEGNEVERYVGTFYRTVRSARFGSDCLGGADPTGRIVEVEGPCEVEGFNEAQSPSFGCKRPDSRLLQYLYHDLTSLTLEPEGGKVAEVREFPQGCDGAALTTSFPSYHHSGQPQRVVDANGNATDFTYDAQGRLLSRTTAGATWTVGYTSHGKVAWVRKPEGNYLVACYATMSDASAAPPARCVEGTGQREQPVWVAIAPNADGSGWLFARRDVWRLGKLLSRQYFDADGSLASETSYSYNGRGHLVGTVGGPASTTQSSQQLLNADGLRLAMGPAENLPPAYCLENGAVSPRCHRFAYDAAGRLSEVTRALDGLQTARDRLQYDAAGNLCGFGPDVDPNGPCGGGLNTTMEYQTDDFGNLVRVTLPNTGSGAKATAIYSYDAAGNLRRGYRPGEFPERYVEYERDRSGRVISIVEHRETTSDGVSISIAFQLVYDGVLRPPGCEGGTHTRGRLAAVLHATGTTYYGYDESGRVTLENVVRHSASSCSNSPESNFLLARTFSPNGNETELTVGARRIWYVHGTNGAEDMVQSVEVTVYDGQASSYVPVARAVRWRADGRLAGYEAWLPATGQWLPVSYRYLQTGSLEQVSVGTQFLQAYDYQSAVPGTGQLRSTPLLRKVTTRYGQELQHQDAFFYDSAGRLTSWTRDLLTTSYAYDARGNRLGVLGPSAVGGLHAYRSGGQPDQLAVERQNSDGTHIRTDYRYDSAGRTTEARWQDDSYGGPAGLHVYSYENMASAAGLGSAIRTLSVNGGAYTYTYDEQQRRRTKFYPVFGARDDFAYALGRRDALQWDVSDSRADSRKVDDVYVWLGGMPIAAVRGAYAPNWARQSDSTLDCSRPGAAGEVSQTPCGLRHVINDYSPKPIYVVDGAGRVVGVAEYSPFGAINTKEVWAETAHPYANNTSQQLASWTERLDGLEQKVRFEFDSFDVEPDRDFVTLLDEAGAAQTTYTGRHGRWVTPWHEANSGSQSLRFSSDSRNCEPGAEVCGPTQRPYAGVALRRVQYQRHSPGVAFWLPPLRYPGQYYDEESGLHENWNRFYSNRSGNYLSPEPLLQDPEYVRQMVQSGLSVPTYAYALNNPIRYVDSNGLDPVAGAAAGAEAGSFAGPAGAAIGAAIGLVAGTAAAAAVTATIVDAPPINWAGTEPGAGVPFPAEPRVTPIGRPASEPGCDAVPTAVTVAMAPKSKKDCLREAGKFYFECLKYGEARVCAAERKMVYKACMAARN